MSLPAWPSLSVRLLEAEADAFDRAVAATPDIDTFCSSSAWVLPAAIAFSPDDSPWIFRTSAGYGAFMRGVHPSGWRYIQPLESVWSLASPIVGPNPQAIVAEIASVLDTRRDDWDVLLIGGIARTSEAFRALVAALGERYALRLGTPAGRVRASLHEGCDAFLKRRSRNFRVSLKRSLRRFSEASLAWEVHLEAEDALHIATLFERMLDIEARSWKGRAGSGMGVAEMRQFYEAMLPMLSAQKRLRLRFARRDDVDVGYVLGATFEGLYRGLQFSFDDRFRNMGLGNVLQWAEMQALEAEGIEVYDLGSDMAYKRRWGDSLFETVTLMAFNRRT